MTFATTTEHTVEVISLIVAYDFFKNTYFDFNDSQAKIGYKRVSEFSISFDPPTPLNPVTKIGVFVCRAAAPVGAAVLAYGCTNAVLTAVKDYLSA